MLELRSLVGDEVDHAVRRELGAGVCRGLGGLRREQRLGAAVHVDHVDVALVDGDRVVHKELCAVGRETGHRPTAAVALHQHARRLRMHRVFDPDVGVFAVAPRRRVREPLAVGREVRAGVARFAVGEQRRPSAGEVVSIELIKLRAAGVGRVHDRVRIAGTKLRPRHALIEKRELPPRAAGRLHQMHLRRVAEARRDDHPAGRGLPVLKRRRSELQIRTHAADESVRKSRNALDH